MLEVLENELSCPQMSLEPIGSSDIAMALLACMNDQ